MAKIIPGKNGSKRDVITQKASALFRKKGFTATSMRDIGDAIGVEAPSLYNHIESKNAILKDICFRIAGLFTGNLRKVELSQELYLSKIERIIRFHICMMIEEYESVYISDHEWKHLPEPFLSDFKTRRRNYRSRLAAILQKGIDNNEIDAVNPYIAILTILSAISGIESWQRTGKKVDAKLLEEDMVKILVEGLKYHPVIHSANNLKALKKRTGFHENMSMSKNRKS
jgi:TetR/AcrR family transcriptional regulator, cholesterol catabolism regulator